MVAIIIEVPAEVPAGIIAAPIEAERYPTFEYDDWELDDTWSCDRYEPIE